MTSYHGQPGLRNGLVNGALNKRRNSDELPDYASQYIPTFAIPPPEASSTARYRSSPRDEPLWEPYWTRAKIEAWRHMRAAEAGARSFRVRNLLSLRLALILVWVYVLFWGEESTFNAKVGSCEWNRWEDWVRFRKADLHNFPPSPND